MNVFALIYLISAWLIQAFKQEKILNTYKHEGPFKTSWNKDELQFYLQF